MQARQRTEKSQVALKIQLGCWLPGVVAHACHPGTWEAETGGSQVQGQPQQLSETLFPNKK